MKFVSLMFCSLLWATPTYSQSNQENHALKSAAWAQVIAKRCDQLELNWNRLGVVMALAGLKPEDVEPGGRRGREYSAHLRDALSNTQGQSTAVVCATGVVLYGPNGRNIPDGLTRK